jgi:hypothetical protein
VFVSGSACFWLVAPWIVLHSCWLLMKWNAFSVALMRRLPGRAMAAAAVMWMAIAWWQSDANWVNRLPAFEEVVRVAASGDANRGETTWSRHCVGCHDAGSPLAPRLTGTLVDMFRAEGTAVATRYVVESILWPGKVVRRRLDGPPYDPMQDPGPLTLTEVADVTAFVIRGVARAAAR